MPGYRIRIASVLENCPRLSRVVTHGSRLFETHFSQDGQSLVTSADDGTARLWSLAHAEEVRVFHHAATGNVYTAASSPDDRWVATGGEDRRTRVWDAHAGSERHAPLQHGAPVWFARFSPDGTRLVTCEASGDVSLWDCATGRREGEPLRHSQGVYAASFSQDGRWLATIDNGWNAVVWDLKTRERRLQTQAWDSQDSVSFSPDSRQLVTCVGASRSR